jgi:hypothetical protein
MAEAVNGLVAVCRARRFVIRPNHAIVLTVLLIKHTQGFCDSARP